jgi:hypothetical protein
MKRTPLKRKTPLKQRTRMKQRRATRRKSERVRDTPWMLMVKRLPCCVRGMVIATPCRGPVEADHVGRRPLGRKCNDQETIPLCRKHHRERTDWSGMFRTWQKEYMQNWLKVALGSTQLDVSRMLVEFATDPGG